MCYYKIMKNKLQNGFDYRITKHGKLIVKEIPKILAKETIIKNHYSHSFYHTFGVLNFGIFLDDKYLGCAVFGWLKVPNSYKKIRSDIERNEILELNRLWVDDELGKNSESVFLSLCFKQIKNKYKHIKIIQSFADGRLGCGTIYKASNFKYYGFHKTPFFRDLETNKTYNEMVFHSSTRPGVITRNLIMINGNFEKFYVKTYRYLYCLDGKYEKVLLKEQPYPEYEKGEIKEEWKLDLKKCNKFIDNAIKYMFFKLNKDYFKFEFNSNKYLYTKDDYKSGKSVFDIIKNNKKLIKLF